MIRNAKAQWNGGLKDGNGTVALGSGAYEGQYSFTSRFESGTGTNPEELVAAAHAGCFSMALSNMLAMAGHVPTSVHTTASVHLGKDDKGFKVTHIELDCVGDVPGVTAATFLEHAEKARVGCIIARALAGPDIQLKARLK